MAPIKVVVHGATGKMGREVVAALSRERDLEPVAGVCRQPREGSLRLPDGSRSLPLSTDLEQVLEQTIPQVVVDFTNAEASMRAALISARKGINFVTGTTGLNEGNLKELEAMAAEQGVGIVVAPNFALGAVLLMHLAKQAAPFFEYADIVEMHHEAKIDSPSGTALALARAVSQGREFKRNIPEKEPIPGARGGDYKGVGIHSVRMPGRSAHHEIIFGIAGQTLSLRHDVLSRDCYMPGVVRAVREVVTLKGLVVGLDRLLGL